MKPILFPEKKLLTYLYGLLITLLAGCGTTNPPARPDYLQDTDLILLHARTEEDRNVNIYAVTRSQTTPVLWQSEVVADTEAVTAVSYGYLAHGRFPYYPPGGKMPAYYGANGRHYVLPQPEQVERANWPPEPEDDTLRNGYITWSDDGRYIAHTIHGITKTLPLNSPRPLILYDTETEQSKLIHEDAIIEPQVWSADGRYLFANIGYTLKRWDRENETWTPLSNTSLLYQEMSPDGQKILWYPVGSSGPIYWSDANGDNLQPLLEDSYNPRLHIHWSPDGRFLAFQNTQGVQTLTIHIANLQDGTIRKIYETSHPWATSGFMMTWAPDSQRIAFIKAVDCSTSFNLAEGTRSTCNSWELFVVSINGGGERRITQTDASTIRIDDNYTIAWLTQEAR
ncbi:MAG: WD40 repeat domain-containing protein [Chloroflexota bacterium]